MNSAFVRRDAAHSTEAVDEDSLDPFLLDNLEQLVPQLVNQAGCRGIPDDVQGSAALHGVKVDTERVGLDPQPLWRFEKP
nr:hypothetical protein [Tanacetum cinerariifolium]